MTSMAEVWQDDNVKAYMSALQLLSREALPATVAYALNAPASAIEKEAKRNVQSRLIVRTQFTLNSIRHDRHARGPNIDRMYSRVGSYSPYLHKHDEGHVEKANNKKIPIPTIQGARGGNIQRRIKKEFHMDKLQLGPGGNMFIGKPKGFPSAPVGIYQRLPKKGRSKKLQLIRDLTQSTVRIPAVHWYTDAFKKYGTPQFIRAQFIAEAQRNVRALSVRMDR